MYLVGSSIDINEFDLEKCIPYFKQPIDYTKSKYETLMDPLTDKIQHLPKSKQTKYKKLMVNIIAHLSVLSKMIEKEIKDLNKVKSIPENDLESDVEITYLPNGV